MGTGTILDEYTFRSDASLLFNPKTGVQHSLNETAALIVGQLLEGKSKAVIAQSLATEYEVSTDEVAQDIDDLLAELASPSTMIPFYEFDKGIPGPLGFPLRLEIELTMLCNWNCGFCYNVWRIDPELSDREILEQVKAYPTKHIARQHVFDVLDECHEKGCSIIRYSGGEPTLHPDLLEILEYGAKRNMYQVLFTNGHFLSEEYCASLARYNVRTVLISLHGGHDTHVGLTRHKGAYDRALKGIASAVNAGLEVVVEFTCVRANQAEIIDTMRRVYALGVRQFGIMRYVATGKRDEEYAVPYSSILPLMQEVDRVLKTECIGMKVGWPCGQKFCVSDDDHPLSFETDDSFDMKLQQLTGHCGSGLVWGSISFEGRVRNCPHSNVYHGSIVEESLESAWQRMTQRVQAALVPRASCSGCQAYSLCKGGCHLPLFLNNKLNLTRGKMLTVRNTC